MYYKPLSQIYKKGSPAIHNSMDFGIQSAFGSSNGLISRFSPLRLHFDVP